VPFELDCTNGEQRLPPSANIELQTSGEKLLLLKSRWTRLKFSPKAPAIEVTASRGVSDLPVGSQQSFSNERYSNILHIFFDTHPQRDHGQWSCCRVNSKTRLSEPVMECPTTQQLLQCQFCSTINQGPQLPQPVQAESTTLPINRGKPMNRSCRTVGTNLFQCSSHCTRAVFSNPVATQIQSCESFAPRQTGTQISNSLHTIPVAATINK